MLDATTRRMANANHALSYLPMRESARDERDYVLLSLQDRYANIWVEYRVTYSQHPCYECSRLCGRRLYIKLAERNEPPQRKWTRTRLFEGQVCHTCTETYKELAKTLWKLSRTSSSELS